MTAKTDIHADLAYMRELAEAGHRAPLLGGRFLVFWGALTSLTFLAHWAIWVQVLPLGPNALLPLWLGFIAVGSLGGWLLGRSVERKPGAGSAGNRAQAAVWPMTGLGIGVYFIGVLLAVSLGRLEPVFFNTMLPIGFLGYGVAWLTTALISRDMRLAMPGLAALAGVVACMLLLTTAEVYLAASAIMVFAALLPGLLMMRGEPKDLV